MTDINIKFGEKVRKIRISKGITQEKLASQSGLHRTYISDIERGTRNISLKNIEKIARSLGVQPDQLLKK